MKKLIRVRVVPIIVARVSCETAGIAVSSGPGWPYFGIRRSALANRFSTRLKILSTKSDCTLNSRASRNETKRSQNDGSSCIIRIASVLAILSAVVAAIDVAPTKCVPGVAATDSSPRKSLAERSMIVASLPDDETTKTLALPFTRKKTHLNQLGQVTTGSIDRALAIRSTGEFCITGVKSTHTTSPFLNTRRDWDR